MEYQVKDKVTCYITKPLAGNSVAPPLEVDKEYKVKDIFVCGCKKQHLDVGLVSNYNWVTCHSCQEELPSSDEIHWCHPSRFEPPIE